MEKSYWQSRWLKDKIGFHTPEMDPSFLEYWPNLFPKKNAKVLVPLCGKATEMKWLSDNGYKVLGVEFVSKACEDFFKTINVLANTSNSNGVNVFEFENIKLHNIDFFKLNPKIVGFADYVYDRAALIALPENKRQLYVETLKKVIKPGTHILLITLEYNQSEMSGPPFSVSFNEVKQLFGDGFKIDLLETREILGTMVKFRDRGITRLYKNVIHIRTI